MSNAYELLPAQRALFEVPHDEPTDIACYMGGMGSGKTTAGVLLGLALSRLFPGSRGLVGARSHALLRDTTRALWSQLLHPSEVIRHTRDPDNLVFRNGSEVWFRHLSDPARLASLEFSWIHVEEGAQISLAAFQALLARLRYTAFTPCRPELTKRFRLFITTTPEERRGWLHETFVEPRIVRPNVRLIRAATADNYALLARKPDYLRILREHMDAELARLYVDGTSELVGDHRAYRAFTREGNVHAALPLDPQRPLHFSFDFNVDFMIALVIQEAADGRTYVLAEEVLRGGADTPRLCARLREHYGTHRAGFVVHGDASGHARDHRSSDTDYTLISRALGDLPGFRLKRPKPGSNPGIRDRLNAVNARLANAPGERKLWIDAACRYLIRSLEETRLLPARFEKEKVRDPHDPRFVVDHPGDALDYYIADEHPLRLATLCRQVYL